MNENGNKFVVPANHILSDEFVPQIAQKNAEYLIYLRNQRHLWEPVMRYFTIDLTLETGITIKDYDY